MKPLQVAVLVVVSAVAGGLFMKWEISRNTAPASVAAAPPPMVTQPVVRASEPPMETKAQPVEAVEPLPVTERKVPVPVQTEPVPKVKPREVLTSRRTEPVMMAKAEELQPPQATPDTAPAVALPPVQQPSLPTPDSQPVQAAYPEPSQQVKQPDPAASIPAATPVNQVTLKAGMTITVRTGEGLSSDRNSAGDGFSATLDQPLIVDGWVIAEKGARAEGKVVETGKGKANPGLVVELTQLRTSDGQRIPIETETFSKHAQIATGDTATKVAAGAVIGAVIGAIAGGGKGAAIGAGAGTAVGAGTAAATRSRPAVLPAESLVHFRLKNAVTITERPRN